MKSAVNLNNLSGIPPKFIRRLDALKGIFRNHDYVQSLNESDKIIDLIEEIDNFCLNKTIVGFHYSRAAADEISANGLTCRKGDEIRAAFLKRHFGLFTNRERKLIHEAWGQYFDKHDIETRDSRLFFNFTTHALEDSGAEPLLSNFGGEQVYMPLLDIESVSVKIGNIGQPLIIKCSLDPNNIRTFCQYPWGNIAVSTFHSMINPNAYRYDQDGYQVVNVMPEDLEIVYFDAKLDYRGL